MKCQSKTCLQEIPDDSCFCDQCGVQLLKCTKCGAITLGKFCNKCGGPTAAISPAGAGAPGPTSRPTVPAPASAQPAPPPVQSAPAQPSAPPVQPPTAPAAGATVVISMPTGKISLCHPAGWSLPLADGDVLGRTNGPHAARLGAFPVISSNHARVVRQGNDWCLMDLNSTNKTYVNGAKLEPNVPAKIKQNDVVVLANVTFTVRET